MSGKFGWEKANARDAAKRGAASPATQPNKRRRKAKRVRQARRQQREVQQRWRCPCGSFRVVTTITPGGRIYRCDGCQSSRINPESVQVRVTGRTFVPLHSP